MQKARKKKTFPGRLLAAASAIFLIAVIVAVFLCFAPFFDIRTIKVDGCSRYTDEDIILASGIKPGVNGFRGLEPDPSAIFDLRLKSFSNRLSEQFPYIKKADAYFIPMNSVIIRVVERKAIMLVHFLGTSLLVDGEMYAVDSTTDASESGLPVVTGLDVRSYNLGSRLDITNPAGFDDAKSLLSEIEAGDASDGLDLMGCVDGVDVSDPGNISLMLDSRIKVNFGGLDNLEYNIDYLKQIFFKHIKKDDEGVIDFTTGDNPLFMK